MNVSNKAIFNTARRFYETNRVVVRSLWAQHMGDHFCLCTRSHVVAGVCAALPGRFQFQWPNDVVI